MMHTFLKFFKSYTTEDTLNDCSIQVDDILVVLAYPMVILIGPAPTFHDSEIDVKKEGLNVGLGKYPIMKFLDENPDSCMKIVKGHAGLERLFNKWKKEQGVSSLS